MCERVYMIFFLPSMMIQKDITKFLAAGADAVQTKPLNITALKIEIARKVDGDV
jgi:hypothetical protein